MHPLTKHARTQRQAGGVRQPAAMAPAIFVGVNALVSVFNDDGTSACKHIEELIREHGGAVAKRLSSATHLIWRNGDPNVLIEAKEMRKKVSG